MKLATVEQMRGMDRFAMEQLGIDETILMENAAHASLTLLRKKFRIRGGKFVIFCGAGNNGGDGLALARLILSLGGRSKVFLTASPKKYGGAAKINYDILCNLAADVQLLGRAEEAREDLRHCDAVIDAIFGTGLDRDVRGLAADVIALVNASGRPVLALDIPSGISGDTGQVMGTAVRADCTVAFGLPKLGNLLYPGYEHCGELVVTHISFPPSLVDREKLTAETNDRIVLPPRRAEAYKGAMGDVLFIAGGVNYFGAPFFSAMSFLKAGGGYARLAAPASIIPFIAQSGREIVYLPQRETAALSLSLKAKPELLQHAEKADMVVIGPGLSLHDETAKLVRELAAVIVRPLLIDGDGITAVAERPEILLKRKAPTILTPHAGEMARLTRKTVAEVNADKIGWLRATSGKLNATVVFKGAHSLIGLADGRVFVNLSGNPGMATAGSGDVLTGCIAAMHGLGLDPETATRQGVFVHGYAGDLAAREKGQDGIVASDVLEHLPQALKEDRAGTIAEKFYAPPLVA
ncbi:MAG: NAD(P)H-hydrate dehydratase [Deltaproteobacteria bacterium]|mgnify:FL=1|jgi:NAD(P)H-hydrate epimerase|nr:NAD(P)H-hydrate dehydratase [Syntrophaceae bacterium]